MGFSELVLVLLSLSGLGVQQNTNAPGAAEVLKYAPDNVDYFVYLDAEAVLPGNWKVLEGLPDNAVVKGNAALKAEAKQLVEQAKQGREMVKNMIGLDPITDVKSVAAFVTFKKGQEEPEVIVVARGTFPADFVDKVAKMTGGKTEAVDGRALAALEDGMALSSGADGSLIFGTAALVKARAATAWKPSKAKALTANVGATLDAKPFFVFTSTPSAQHVAMMQKHLKGDPDAAIVLDLATGHELFALALSYNGIGWAHRARTAAGYERAVLGSEGMVELMRAGHLLTRGAIRIALAVAESYATQNQAIGQIVKNRDKIIKIMETWTGDGQFQATVDKKKGDKTVTVMATGKSLSQVVPIAGLAVPAGMVFLFTGGMRKKEAAREPANDNVKIEKKIEKKKVK
jgi:hypothetical protein